MERSIYANVVCVKHRYGLVDDHPAIITIIRMHGEQWYKDFVQDWSGTTAKLKRKPNYKPNNNNIVITSSGRTYRR